MKKQIFWRHALLCSLLGAAALGLTSCKTAPNSTDASVTEIRHSVQYYLDAAQRTQGAERHKNLLLAARLLLEKEDSLRAQEVLAAVDKNSLPPQLQDDYYLAAGKLALLQNQPELALQRLRQVTNLSLHQIEWQIDYQQTLADAYLASNNYFESAQLRIGLEDLLTDPQAVSENHDRIWLALKNINPDFLNTLQNGLNSPTMNGWLEIVRLTQQHQSDPEQLMLALQQWQQRYPLHPAAESLPSELQRLADAKIYRPQHIALLLPLNGRLGQVAQTIRDGFLAAHYLQPIADEAPTIKIYDTSESINISELVNKAAAEGADFIVGPLDKEAVDSLLTQESLATPMLALNVSETETLRHQEFFQFGLPVEQEAQQIARDVWQSGKELALLLLPSGSVGVRTERAFKDQFEKLGGEVVGASWYDGSDELSAVVKEMLQVSSSEQRKSTLRQIIGRDVEFEPRRRQDADFVLMSAPANLARRLKPFINYYFGFDLPVYATSNVYDGVVNNPLNRDLEGIRFIDSPWLIAADSSERRKEIQQLLPHTGGIMQRFFAFGFDAYTLVPHLSKLRALDEQTQTGLTGALKVNQQGIVIRELNWARFKNATPLPFRLKKTRTLNGITLEKTSD